ncbi:MAG TPA: DUF87 domain-containing protein [Afifellaceae bacterium]|nr:DUF87 domain-containing protein [Afifellaceae bacterium]
MRRGELQAADERLAELMGGRRFDPNGAAAPAAATPKVAPMPAPPVLAESEIDLGRAEIGRAPVGIDLPGLVDGRMLVQGTSGAGKSWTLRRLLEQSAGRLQQIVVDPEGEFGSLAEAFGHLHVEAHLLDIAALAIAARRAREHRLSLVLDLSECDREEQMKAVAAFLSALIEAPREHWHPCLLAIDEAHLFAPFGGHSAAATSVKKAAIGALTDLMSRGRKRGLAGVLATQRLARLAKSVASEVHNFLVGLNTLDLDIRRAAETIGWDARRAFDRLPMLEPGNFVAVGPAFSQSPCILKVGGVQTFHRGAAPEIGAPAALDPGEASKLLDLEALVEASEAEAAIRAEDSFQPGTRAVRGFIRDPAFAAAGAVWQALVPLAPEGARVADLAGALGLQADQVAAALALLDCYGALDFSGEGQDRAVRIPRGMLP